MTFIQIIFYVLSAVAIGSGAMVVIAKNPVRGALFLVMAFMACAGLWLLLHAEFLALILVLVYVGAVMTLFLFVVMMLSIDVVSSKKGLVRYLPIGALIVLLIVGMILIVVGPKQFGVSQFEMPPLKPANYSNVQALGDVLYTQYVYPFELAAVLLLTAIIAAITLTFRGPVKRRTQSIAKQVAASPKDRVRIVKMISEKRVRPQEAE